MKPRSRGRREFGTTPPADGPGDSLEHPLPGSVPQAFTVSLPWVVDREHPTAWRRAEGEMHPATEFEDALIEDDRRAMDRRSDLEWRAERRTLDIRSKTGGMLRRVSAAYCRVQLRAAIATVDAQPVSEQASHLVEASREHAEIADELGGRRVVDASLARDIRAGEPGERDVTREPLRIGTGAHRVILDAPRRLAAA